MYIRDSRGNITGRVQETPTNKYVFDVHGTIVASYNKQTNTTTSGSTTVREEQLLSFMKK